MTSVIVLAPMAGWLAPLGEVPDAAFAEGLSLIHI